MDWVRAYLFGSLRLERGGQILGPFPSQKARALCAYLLLYGDRPQPRARLAGLFWGDLPEARARRGLSDALWRLRQVTGSGLLEEDERGLRLASGARLWVDVTEFLRLTRVLRRQGGRLGEEDLEQLRQAIRLYRGDLLEDFYDDWVLLERERCRGLYLTALQVLAQAAEEAGRWEEALAYAERLVQADPLYEASQRLLMRLYARAGRPQLALAQFRALERLLDQELGVPPTEETRRLARQIETEVEAAAGPPAGDPGLLPLVGRVQARKRLIGRVETLARGQGWGLLVLGEEGIGKSRLAAVALEGARWRGIRTAHAYCQQPEETPYGPFLRLLRPLSKRFRAALETRLPPEERRLVEGLLMAEQEPSAGYSGYLEPTEAVTRVMARAVSALGVLGPCLLVVEDVHLADEGTLATLEALLPMAPREGLGLVLTARDRAPENGALPRDWLTRLEAAGLAETLPLGPLDEDDVAELLGHALSGRRPEPSVVQMLTRASGGNPLFLLELAREFDRQGDGDWQAFLARLPVSPRVQAVIEARLDHLSPDESELLAQAAVLGDQVPIEVLEAASGLPKESFLTLSDRLLNAGLLREEEGALLFFHHLTRQVVLQRISQERRRRYHLRAAEALRRHAPEEVETLAGHLEAGEDWGGAWPVLRAAAVHSLRAAQYSRARDFYDRALRALERAGEPKKEARLQVLWEKGGSLLSVGEVQEATQAARALLAESESEEPLWQGRGWLLLSEARYFEGDLEGSRKAAEEAVRFARRAKDPGLEGRALLALVWAGPPSEPFPRRREAVLERVLPLLSSAGSREGLLDAYSLLGGLEMRQCRLQEAQRHYLRARALAQELGWVSRYWMMEANLAEVEYERGRLERARARAQATYQAFERLGITYGQAGTADILAWIHLALGMPGQALEWARRNEVHARAVGFPLGQFFAHLVQALALEALGDLDDAVAEARRAGLVARDLNEAHALAGTRWVRGRLALLQGEVTEGLQLVEAAWNQVAEAGLWFLGVRVAAERIRAGLAAKDTRQARRAAAQALWLRRRLHGEVCYSEEIWAAVAEVHLACGEERRARWARLRGWADLAERASRLRDTHLRATFLERSLAQSLTRIGQTAPSPYRLVHLPACDEKGAQTPVIWHVGNRPPRGRPARRRLLRRLLRQAALQGARPDLGRLAEVLGVSERTVRDDLKALSQCT